MLNGPTLTEYDMVLRLCVSLAAGTLIGLERSWRRQVAGLRTHVLICVGATLLMLLSIWIPQAYNGADPARIAAQVVSGIGFLGAGAILRLGNNVKGLTTAASLWLVAAIGLALGAGMFLAAAVALALGLVTLIALNSVENKLFPTERNKIMGLVFRKGIPDTTRLLALLSEYGVRMQSMDMEQSLEKGEHTRLRLLVSMPLSIDLGRLTEALEQACDILAVEIKEKY